MAFFHINRKNTLDNYFQIDAAFCRITCIFVTVFHRILDFTTRLDVYPAFFYALIFRYFANNPILSVNGARITIKINKFDP